MNLLVDTNIILYLLQGDKKNFKIFYLNQFYIFLLLQNWNCFRIQISKTLNMMLFSRYWMNQYCMM